MNQNRRQILTAAGMGLLANAIGRTAQAQSSGVKALVFDTFGTVVDWRRSIIAEGQAWGKARGLAIDWARFADRWRAGYAPSMEKVRKGEMPWTKLDVLHRMILGAEVARHYKPDREAYLTAVELLSLKPEEVMMTAAHRQDLAAARSFGLRTGFIQRPNEYGPTRHADTAKPGDFDVVASDMLDLASKMGA